MFRRQLLCSCLAFFGAQTTKAQYTFSNLQELLAFADTKNISIQTDDLKIKQAKQAQWAAKLAIADPNWTNSVNFTNNTQLPVNVFPAEAFGGQPGEFQEVRLGVPYNTSVSSNLDIKLVNLEAWQNLKLARLNTTLTETTKLLNQKALHENLAAAYFNLVQLNAQLESTRSNLTAADTLLQTAERKYAEGIVRQQDVFSCRINQLNLRENTRQIEFSIEKQLLALKVLCGIPAAENMVFTQQINTYAVGSRPEMLAGNLLLREQQLREQSAKVGLQRTNMAFAPTLSFVANNSYNQYNPDFTLFGGNWIQSQYIGFRLGFNLPNANTIANRAKAKYDYQLTLKNGEQTRLQTTSELQQLALDWEKAATQLNTNREVLDLQRNIYLKHQNLYREGLQSIDQTLSSFSAMVNAEYSFIAAQVSIALATAKIDLNNKFNSK